MPDKSPKSNVFFRRPFATDSAAAELDQQYRARLCRLVEREMNRRFRRKEDPEDVVQSAFRTFYRHNAKGEFHIDSSGDLWCLLATITRRKILKHAEKLDAGKRNAKHEEYTEGDDLRGQAPSPEEAAIAADLMEEALAGLDATYVEVLHMKLQKCTDEDIATKLKCSRAFVRSKLKRIRDKLQKLSGSDARK